MNIAALTSYYYRRQAYSEELTAWLAAGTAAGYTLPSTTVQNALDALLRTELETGTVASRMKTGYIFHAGSKNMAKLNLKDPATYALTESGTVTWSEGNGVKSASSSYFDQPFAINEYAGIETDLTAINYVSESSTEAASKVVSGFRTHTTALFFIIQPTNSTGNSPLFHYSTGTNIANTQHKGLYINTYNGTENVWYKDGVKNAVAATPTAPNLTGNHRFILAYNASIANGGSSPASYYDKYVACDFLFNRFSDTDAANFKTAFDTYKTAAGLA